MLNAQDTRRRTFTFPERFRSMAFIELIIIGSNAAGLKAGETPLQEYRSFDQAE
jgi:hypothetical protein